MAWDFYFAPTAVSIAPVEMAQLEKQYYTKLVDKVEL
jgi:hypothetical protein